MRVLARVVALALGVASAACGTKPPAPGEPVRCEAGFVARDGACVPALASCDAISRPTTGPACAPVGVAACEEGFARDGAGCVAVAPTAACAAGTFALPGDTTCRTATECPADPFGDVPAGERALFVDASYAGADGDGSRTRPFQTIGAAVAGAVGNPLIAIAAGTYAEDVVVKRPVRLRGRCASMVTLKGSEAGSGNHALRIDATSEVSGIAVTGPLGGVLVTATDTRVRGVWVHDVAGRGISIEGAAGPIVATIQGSLVERSGKAGVFLASAEVRVEESVVRDAGADAPTMEAGILAQPHPAARARSRLTATRVVVERAAGRGVDARDSDASLAAAWIRAMAPWKDEGGEAIVVAGSRDLAALEVRGAVVEDARGVGVRGQRAKMHLEGVTVRRIAASAGGKYALPGLGVFAGIGSELTVVGSTIDAATFGGVATSGSKATLQELLVHDVTGDAAGAGFGVAFLHHPVDGASSGSLLRSAVVAAPFVGVLVGGSDVTIDEVLIRDVRAQKNAQFGDGIGVAATSYESAPEAVWPARAAVDRTFVLGSARGGVVVLGGELSLRRSLLSCNALDLVVSDRFGEGFDAGAMALDDRGDNGCGCGDSVGRCLASAVDLAPLPPPL